MPPHYERIRALFQGDTQVAAQLIDGKAVAAQVHEEVRAGVAARVKAGRPAPSLATVLVGSDPASSVYVGSKRKLCEKLGIRSEHVDLPADVSQAELLGLVDELNADPKIDGILVQLTLPSHIDSELVIERLDPKKDVDGFHPYNLGRLAQKPTHPRQLLRPCTPYGAMRLIESTGVTVRG